MGGFSLLFSSQFLGRLLTDKPRAYADETQLIFPKLDYYLANTADWVSFLFRLFSIVGPSLIASESNPYREYE